MKSALSGRVKTRMTGMGSTGPRTKKKNRALVDWAAERVLKGQTANCMGLSFVTAKKLRDRDIDKVAKRVSEGDAKWLEEGIVWMGPKE